MSVMLWSKGGVGCLLSSLLISARFMSQAKDESLFTRVRLLQLIQPMNRRCFEVLSMIQPGQMNYVLGAFLMLGTNYNSDSELVMTRRQ